MRMIEGKYLFPGVLLFKVTSSLQLTWYQNKANICIQLTTTNVDTFPSFDSTHLKSWKRPRPLKILQCQGKFQLNVKMLVIVTTFQQSISFHTPTNSVHSISTLKQQLRSSIYLNHLWWALAGPIVELLLVELVYFKVVFRTCFVVELTLEHYDKNLQELRISEIFKHLMEWSNQANLAKHKLNFFPCVLLHLINFQNFSQDTFQFWTGGGSRTEIEITSTYSLASLLSVCCQALG